MRGVYYEASRKRWRVRLYKAGQVVYIGYFPTESEAHEALVQAKHVQTTMRVASDSNPPRTLWGKIAALYPLRKIAPSAV